MPAKIQAKKNKAKKDTGNGGKTKRANKKPTKNGEKRQENDNGVEIHSCVCV